MAKPFKRENGTGCVVKLGGRRRRPYAAKVFVGWMRTNNPPRSIPKYKYIGYYATRSECLIALSDYCKNKFKPVNQKTLQEIYEYWLNNNTLSPNTIRAYKSAYGKISELSEYVFKDITASDVLNTCRDLKTNMALLVPSLFKALTISARKLGVECVPIYDLLEFKRPEVKRERIPFTEEEIDLLWERVDDESAKATLVYIYTGFRKNELFGINKNSIDLENWVIKAGIKTSAGKNRQVPIHTRIRPLIEYFYNKNYKNFFSDSCEHTFYQRLQECWFKLGMNHVLHETRHTFETRLDNAGVPLAVRNKLTGHSNGNVGDDVYNHKTLDQLRTAIELLR